MNLIDNLKNVNAYGTAERNLIGRMGALALEQLIEQLQAARLDLIACDRLELVTLIDEEIQSILQEY